HMNNYAGNLVTYSLFVKIINQTREWQLEEIKKGKEVLIRQGRSEQDTEKWYQDKKAVITMQYSGIVGQYNALRQEFETGRRA
ncbi:hypothetical protein KGQ71_01245, partial [Patescibacteria group bacterium]|nr:hypothetical protein [Patescibacteria group bacterium]